MEESFQGFRSRHLLKNKALLVVWHGSGKTPEANHACSLLVEKIKAQGIFAEAACCFWDGEPSIQQAVAELKSQEVFVVPAFISEGYYTRQIIPRELGFENPEISSKAMPGGGPLTGGIFSAKSGKVFYYCSPVGRNDLMGKLILQKAQDIVPQELHSKTTLFVVGHGSEKNAESSGTTKQQVEWIKRAGTTFSCVQDIYLEEVPFVSDWLDFCFTGYAVAIPFFMIDGPHSCQDIPKLFGIQQLENAKEQDIFSKNPFNLGEKKLFYSRAIGTDLVMSEIILQQVQEFLDLKKRSGFFA